MGFSSGNKPTGLVDLDTAQTVENKTIQTSSIESPTRSDVKQDTYANLSDYAAGTGAYAGDGAASNGQLCFASDQKKMYQVIDSGLAEVGGSAGGGGYNYNDNSFDDDVSSVTSSANIIATQETVSPLLGSGSLKITKDAADRSAQHIILKSFSIDEAHKATVFEVEAGIKINSGVVADEDWEIYAYDNTNSKEIELVPKYVYFSEGFTAQHKATFQTSSNGVSYDLRMRPNSNANAQELLLDGFGSSMLYVGPQIGGSSGPVISDWEDFTPTGTWITNTTYTGYKRRVGDTEEYDILVSLTGAPTSANLQVNLPNTIDTSKITGTSFANALGVAEITDGGASGVGSCVVLAYNATSVMVGYDVAGSVAIGAVNQAVPIVFANADSISLRFSVPIAGWSSNQVLSSESSSREIFASASIETAGNTISANTKTEIVYENLLEDSSSSYDISNGRFTAPESGLYNIDYIMRFDTGAVVTGQYLISELKVNGSTSNRFGAHYTTVTEISASTTYGHSGSGSVRLNKGDYVSLWIYSAAQSATYGYISKSGNGTRINVHKIQSPQQIAASEKVYGFANTDGTANGVITSGGTGEPIIWENVLDDSRGIMNSTNGELSMPKAGQLTLATSVTLENSSGWNDGERLILYFNVNGTNVIQKTYELPATPSSLLFASIDLAVTGYSVVKGDVIIIRVYQESGVDQSLSSSNSNTVISWEIS